jgi:predicted transcriptional regulator YdeE
MEDVKKVAMTIFHSYEDSYLDKDRRKNFEELFEKYLTKVDTKGTMEIYDAVIKLEHQYRSDYDSMVKALKEHSLLPE